MTQPMMWAFAVLIVLAMGAIAMIAAGRGEPLAPAYDDRADAEVPADRPIGPDDLRRVRFSLALRGYRMSEVDALLSRLAAELEARDGDHRPPDLPMPERMRALAEEWAADFGTDDRRLDFSVESTDHVDDLIATWSKGRRRRTEQTGALWGAGAYVGEVLIRAVPGSRWSGHEIFGDLPVVETPSGAFDNPVGKAMSRYENGPEDSVAFFTQAALAAEERRGEGADDASADGSAHEPSDGAGG